MAYTLRVLPPHGYRRGAHHPHCNRHAHHLIWIAGHPLCLGCFCLYTGVAIGLVLSCALLFLGRWPLFGFAMIQIALVAPSAAQPWLQRRPFKIFARTSLGVAIATYVFGAAIGLQLVTQYPWSRLGLALLMLGIYQGLTTLRRHHPSDPCDDCPLGHFPACEWNLPALLAATDDPLLSSIPSADCVSIHPALPS